MPRPTNTEQIHTLRARVMALEAAVAMLIRMVPRGQREDFMDQAHDINATVGEPVPVISTEQEIGPFSDELIERLVTGKR
jgi:hypothetical protein